MKSAWNAILVATDANAVEAAHAAALAELGDGARADLDPLRRVALDRIDLQARLDAATRSRETLLASISHDLRNPLNTFAMSAGLLREDVERGEVDKTRDLGLIQRMERAIERMQHLIEDLGEASRLEARRIMLARRSEPVARILGEAIAAAGMIATERVIALTTGSIVDAAVDADRARIVMAFVRLVSYCVRAIGDKGSIVVGARAVEAGVEIAMTASPAGGGPVAKLEEGRGSLPLLLARALVELHGGVLTIEHTHTLDIRFTLPKA